MPKKVKLGPPYLFVSVFRRAVVVKGLLAFRLGCSTYIRSQEDQIVWSKTKHPSLPEFWQDGRATCMMSKTGLTLISINIMVSFSNAFKICKDVTGDG
jgi:hypothetical protein